jgi:acetamidase/formamidase
MKRVERDPEKFRYVFSNKFSPVLEVKPGEEFTLETEDAFGGKIKTTYRLASGAALARPSSHASIFESSCGPCLHTRSRAGRHYRSGHS